MGFKLDNKDILTNDIYLESFSDFFSIPNEVENENRLESKIDEIRLKDIDYELKSNILNKYSHYKNAKSLKESKALENEINKLIEKI